jgi:polyisoprenyl-phosphate glycosyltransferase
MDSDGEDRPEDVVRMLSTFRADPGGIVVAKRAERSEGPLFRVFYGLYKALFSALTGKVIDFGNFCLIPRALLGRLVFMPETWNHLAAAIVRSRLKIHRLETRRGTRYAGRSHMNLVQLMIHGLSAISVLSDAVFVRVLILAALSSSLAVMGIAVTVALRLFTELAVPGWASNVVGTMLLILFQTVLLAAAAAFLLLGSRSGLFFIPASDAQRYVRDRTVVFER